MTTNPDKIGNRSVSASKAEKPKEKENEYLLKLSSEEAGALAANLERHLQVWPRSATNPLVGSVLDKLGEMLRSKDRS